MNQAAVRAIMELVFAGLLWGFGFVAAVWALQDLEPFTLTAVRFALATLIAAPVLLLSKPLRRDLSWRQARLAIPPGLFLGAVLILQTWGQKYTTATKSSFITTLYVLLVPLLERVWLKARLHPLHFIFVILGLLGTALMCQFQAGLWNFGDLLTLLCSIVASFHILWFALISDRIGSPVVFNFWQCLWAFLFALPLACFERSAIVPHQTIAWAGLLSLVFGSTLIAFALQVRAQKILPPSMASFLYLLESPFATLFAFTILGERLKWEQWVGGCLILGAIAFSTYLSAQQRDPIK